MFYPVKPFNFFLECNPIIKDITWIIKWSKCTGERNKLSLSFSAFNNWCVEFFHFIEHFNIYTIVLYHFKTVIIKTDIESG